jgi:hypothetical protein
MDFPTQPVERRARRHRPRCTSKKPSTRTCTTWRTQPTRPEHPPPGRPQVNRTVVQRILDGIAAMPAIVIDVCSDLLRCTHRCSTTTQHAQSGNGDRRGVVYQPRSASRCGCAMSSTLMPSRASPDAGDTLRRHVEIVVAGDDRGAPWPHRLVTWGLRALRRVSGPAEGPQSRPVLRTK